MQRIAFAVELPAQITIPDTGRDRHRGAPAIQHVTFRVTDSLMQEPPRERRVALLPIWRPTILVSTGKALRECLYLGIWLVAGQEHYLKPRLIPEFAIGMVLDHHQDTFYLSLKAFRQN